jgi:hypothetical protein
MSSISLSLLAVAVFAGFDPARAEELTPTRIYQVSKPFTNDRGHVAMDISGVACMPSDAARSPCVVIDDQGRFAQVASLENGRIAAGARLPLVGVEASKDTLGQPPSRAGCSGGVGKYKDLDGEAVAYASPFFYVVGSHGCGRHSGKYRSSSFILARIPQAGVVSALSDPAFIFDPSSVKTTYRLSEGLAAAPVVGPFFTRDLRDANGLNIEGLVVSGGILFAGLRAPTLDGMAFIVAVEVEKLFRPGAPINESDVRVISVPLGSDRGIRDLALLNDGRLLVLSGPAHDARLPFEIYILNTADGTTALVGVLGLLTDAPNAKAEAIFVLSQKDNVVDVLVMFDGLPNGVPREYRLSLK